MEYWVCPSCPYHIEQNMKKGDNCPNCGTKLVKRGFSPAPLDIDVPLDEIVMGVNTAAEIWALAPGTIKNLCAAGKIKGLKIGQTWVIDRRQKSPAYSRYVHMRGNQL